MPPSLKLKDHSGREGGTNVRAKRWGRLAKCHLLGFMHNHKLIVDPVTTTGPAQAWPGQQSVTDMGGAHGMLPLAAKLLATETFGRRGVIVFSGQFQTHDHMNVPGYFE